VRRMRSALPKPHSFGDGLDRYDGMFEFAAGLCGPRPFGKLRRRLSGFAAKEARKIARAHGHAIREGGYAEIVPRMPQNPGLKFADVWTPPEEWIFSSRVKRRLEST
jgi:hypothetical protein